MKFLLPVLVIGTVMLGTTIRAADVESAAALAKGGTLLVQQGKPERAKDMLYKALANDENCPEALYELGKIFEAEGKAATAADFYSRASVVMADGEKGGGAASAKRQDAIKRLQKLNPYATRFTSIMEDYAEDLERVHKKIPDSITRDEALSRVDTLKLASFLPPEKLPKIERPVAAPKKDPRAGMEDDFASRFRKKPVETVVPPDVERALKAGGWTKIEGVWKLKAPNVYEVTDGRLEAAMVNGGLQVLVHKGGTGSVSAFVRNGYNNEYSSWGSGGDRAPSYATGVGFFVKGLNAYCYMPTGGWMSNGVYEPYLDRTLPLQEASPKNQFTITINDSALECSLNNMQPRKTTYKMSKEGPFAIIITGTMTIESPMARGR